MDISPLPHKQPYNVAINVTLPSPSPEPTPDEEDGLYLSSRPASGDMGSETLTIPTE